ncbi:MAG: hypothetical protein E6Q98_11745 [Rhodospirillaceae bacterium]|nr:MAG: hypothetical protein E6Q98_11745 [Rhodospirillaceae bacterium]
MKLPGNKLTAKRFFSASVLIFPTGSFAIKNDLRDSHHTGTDGEAITVLGMQSEAFGIWGTPDKWMIG